jgi:serine/threonine protein kinase
MDRMFILIYANDDHFVFEKNDTLFKLQSSFESFRDNEFARKLKHHNRFVFWKRANRNPIKSHLVQLAKEYNPEYIGTDVTLLTSVKKGMDIEKLGYKIDPNHFIKFVNYLKESIDILSREKIAHCDLRWPNIVVDCTELEKNQKLITTSLPIIIDFGQARISAKAYELNNRGFVKLQKTLLDNVGPT